MNSVQHRILDRVEAALVTAGYSVSCAASFSNCGTLHVYEHVHDTASIGQVGFDFQSGYYTLRLTWRGTRVPSQPGRSDYFDFHQRYDEPSRFWDALVAAIKERR